MQKITTVIFVIFMFFTSAIRADEIRVWTSATNDKQKLEAEFVKISEDGKTVTLRKDNREKDFALEQFSKKDQEYIAAKKVIADEDKIADTKRVALRVPRCVWAKNLYNAIVKESRKLVKEPESNIKEYREKAENELEAQLRLALFHFGNKQEEEAIKLWSEAANRENNSKLEQEAVLSFLGVVCFAKKDYSEAQKWTQKVADMGNAGAKEFLREIQMASLGQSGYKDENARKIAKAKQTAGHQQVIQNPPPQNVPIPRIGQFNPQIPSNATVVSDGNSALVSWRQNRQYIQVYITNGRATNVISVTSPN